MKGTLGLYFFRKDWLRKRGRIQVAIFLDAGFLVGRRRLVPRVLPSQENIQGDDVLGARRFGSTVLAS